MISLAALLFIDPATGLCCRNFIASATERLRVYQVYQLKQSLQGGRFDFTFMDTGGMFLAS